MAGLHGVDTDVAQKIHWEVFCERIGFRIAVENHGKTTGKVHL